MPLGDIWVKISKQQPLSQEEEEELRLSGNQLPFTNTYTKQLQDGGAIIQLPSISNPFFTSSALSIMALNRNTDTAITTGTDTPIDFETIGGNSNIFKWALADPQKIRLVYPGQSFGICGRISWEANATGFRKMKLIAYTSADVEIGEATLHSFQGFTGDDNTFPFILGLTQNAIPTLDYFTIEVAHSRGSNLNLLFLNIDIFTF